MSVKTEVMCDMSDDRRRATCSVSGMTVVSPQVSAHVMLDRQCLDHVHWPLIDGVVVRHIDGGKRLPRVPAKAASEGSAMPAVGRRVCMLFEGVRCDGVGAGAEWEGEARIENGKLHVGTGTWTAGMLANGWTWEYIDEPAAVPRRAMSVADLRPGMRIKCNVGERNLALQNGQLCGYPDGHDQPSVNFVRSTNAFNLLSPIDILAEPDAKPVKVKACGCQYGQHEGLPCNKAKLTATCKHGLVGQCGECQREMDVAAREAKARKIGGIDWGASITIPNDWMEWPTFTVERVDVVTVAVTCDIRCVKGRPCDRPGCRQAQLRDTEEALIRETYRLEVAQEAEKQAIIAQWRREQEAPLPVVQPFATLRAALASPFVRVVRRGR
jgi:hypothetical protein